MYKKRKNFTNRAYDNKLGLICDKLIEMNPDAFFAISKRFIEKPDGTLGDEIKTVPVIISSLKIEMLMVPSTYNILLGEYLTNWCDNEPLVKLIYSPMRFSDGDIKGKTISNLYLDIERHDEIQKVLSNNQRFKY